MTDHTFKDTDSRNYVWINLEVEFEIKKSKERIDEINNLRKRNKNHLQELDKLNREIDLLKNIIDECLS